MSDYEIHEPDYSGTTTGDWDSPQENDFETDDFGEIGAHFVLSSSGFPPENFTDLHLPVVDPDGNLNLNALETAHGAPTASRPWMTSTKRLLKRSRSCWRTSPTRHSTTISGTETSEFSRSTERSHRESRWPII